VAPVSIYVVRHAHALPRDGWTGSDQDRPLTDRGVKEAEALVARFDIAPAGAPSQKRSTRAREPRPTLLMSSGAKRCLATLQPLAAACGLPIVIEDFLSEGSDGNGLLVQFKDLAAVGGVPVLCTHGDVIWSLVDLLVAAGTPLSGPVEVRKGSILVLDTESGSVESARYIPPAKV
jgi:8-oxo-dGTP diphosphatase